MADHIDRAGCHQHNYDNNQKVNGKNSGSQDGALRKTSSDRGRIRAERLVLGEEEGMMLIGLLRRQE